MTNLQSFFASTLANAGFVKVDSFAESLALSVLADIPAIYHGRGGYGKTEQILTAIKSIKSCSFSMLECDPETTASSIKGCAIARTRKGDKEDLTEAFYNVAASVLSYDAFFFEEMLDASFNALSVLKAVITNKQLTINGETVISKNKILVGATNLNPSELLESLPDNIQNSYEAFLQRFMLIEHGWDSHTAEDYALLDADVSKVDISSVTLSDIEFQREYLKDGVVLATSLKGLLQHLAAKSGEAGKTVSPRAYKWTQRLIKASALLADKETADEADLNVLKYLPYWDTSIITDLEKEIEVQKQHKLCVDKLAFYQQKIQSGFNKLNNPDKGKLVGAAIVWKLAKQLESEITNSGSYPDSLQKQYQEIKKKASDLVNKAASERDAAIQVNNESL